MKWVIYKHTNKINGKVYIGQTKSKPEYRWNNGKGYTHRNPDSHFARAINKYGFSGFTHEIIEDNIPSLELANERETYWIKFYNSVDNGYNANYGGDSRLPSDETISKLRRKSKAMWGSEDYRNRMSALYNSKEYHDKMSQIQKDIFNKHPERKEQIAKSKKGKITLVKNSHRVYVNANEVESYIKNGYQKSAKYIPTDELARIIFDYQNDLIDASLEDLTIKYGYGRRTLIKHLEESGVEIVDKSYRQHEKMKGKKFTKEHKNKIRDALIESKGRFFSKEEIDSLAKKIQNGQPINKLARYTYHCDRMLLKKWIEHYGYKYSDLVYRKSGKATKKVMCVENKLVFRTTYEAAKSLKANNYISLASQISSACKHKNRTAGGYHWKYID